MLTLTIAGHLGKDATLSKEVNGQVAINFSVAHTVKWTDKNNVKKERTTWVECAYWRKKEETDPALAQYLKKGTSVVVIGEPDARAWVNDNTGELRANLTLRVDDLQLMGQPKPKATASQERTVDNPSTEDALYHTDRDRSEVEDDLPY